MLNLIKDTVKKMMDHHEEIQELRPLRGYVGASEIGHICDAKIWLDFRKCSMKSFSAKSLFSMADGEYSETITAKRLSETPGIKLTTINPKTGQQFAAEFFHGHIKGNIDGIICGVNQSPKKEMIWEHKCVGQAYFNKVQNLYKKIPYENILENWNPIYFAQAQSYMHMFNIDHHFMTISLAGSRDYLELITTLNYKISGEYLQRAKNIITSDGPGEKLGANKLKSHCNLCSNFSICHEEKLPVPNCRNCINCNPILDDKNPGAWRCELFKTNLSNKEQDAGCLSHLYAPKALSFMAVQYDCDDHAIYYERKSDGVVFKNQIDAKSKESNSASLFLNGVDANINLTEFNYADNG